MKVKVLFFIMTCLCVNIMGQTISVDKPSIKPAQDKYKAVEVNNLIHAVEGSSTVYKISVSGFGDITSVVRLTYNTTDVTSKCHLDNGVLTIDDIEIPDLQVAEETIDFKITLVVREKDKEEDTECSAEAMKIKVYPVPTVKGVEEPKYLTYYKDTEADLKWEFSGDGGNIWNCSWNIDNSNITGEAYTLSRVTGPQNSRLKLTAVNTAPDGTTIWEQYEESWDVVVLPEASIQPAVDDNTNKNLFQDQSWPLSVSVSGGYNTGWEYSWAVDEKTISEKTNSYTLSISEDERATEKINRKVKLIVKNNLPDGTKPTSELLEWTYNYSAEFYPCPIVRFEKQYPQNICHDDQMPMGLLILDGQNNSLFEDPDYTCDCSWGSAKGREYTFVGNNSSNNDGELYTIKCNISVKHKDIELPFTATLQHNATVWPLPSVQQLSEAEAKVVSCGGRTVTVSLKTSGGQKNGWQFYYGKKDATPTSSNKNTHSFPIIRESQRSSTPIKEEYILRAVNSVEGAIRCDVSQSMTVDVYPEPWMPNDIILTDKNRNTPVGNGIREGNEVGLLCEECYGGYPNKWSYSWTQDNNIIGNTNAISSTIADIYNGEAKNNSTAIRFKCEVNNYYGDEQWAKKEYLKQLTIYNKPKTPQSLVKKGNGTSRTLIAIMTLNDEELQQYEYYLVFGYQKDDGGIITFGEPQRQQNPGQTRWSTQIPAEYYSNESGLCVYALWKYDGGAVVTSGLRFLDGTANETWDGSDFTNSTRIDGDDATSIQEIPGGEAECQKVYENYSITGISSKHLVKGLNIVRMSDGTIRKIMKK